MSKYLLYYAGFNDDSGEEQVGVATSDDFKVWNYIGDMPQIPLKSQGVNDSTQTSNPCVLKHDGIYKMWYQGKSKEGFLSVCYSESKDGLVWKSYDKPVLSPNLSSEPKFREGFQHPHVIFDKDKNIFKMWCVVYRNGLTSIGLCESVNGLVWTEMKLTSFVGKNEEHKYFYPFVMKEGNEYKAWYTERIGKKWQISFAKSNDGIDWEIYENNPVLSTSQSKLVCILLEGIAKISKYIFEIPIYGIGSPFVWKEEGKYKLIGHSVGPRGKLFIPLYESQDGYNWKRLNNNILPKSNSAWNKFFQADPFLYVE